MSGYVEELNHSEKSFNSRKEVVVRKKESNTRKMFPFYFIDMGANIS